MGVDVHYPLQPNAITTNKGLSVAYGDERISFERKAKQGKARKVLIKVQPDCKVLVHAPEDASDELVTDAVKKRSRWIYTQLRDFSKQLEHITPRKYVSGESHYYLGKQYVLKVIVDTKATPSVKLLRGSLEVTARRKSPKRIKELLDDWYRERAKEMFHKRLEAMLEQTLWVKQSPPLKVMAMKKQWGSCSPNGRLTLNLYLIKAPRDCIDYVILHELCHIAEHNHSKRFYRLMGQVMPGWEKVKKKLDSSVSQLLSL